MIAKAIEGPLFKTSIKKLSLCPGLYYWTDAGGIIRIDGPTMVYLIFKIINPSTRMGVSNLKYEIGKATLAKFGNIINYLLDDMDSNDSIITEKGECHDDYVR